MMPKYDVTRESSAEQISAHSWLWAQPGRRVWALRRSTKFRTGAVNSTSSIADYLAQPLLMLLATPFLVHRLGLDRYGVWVLVSALSGSLGIFSFGLGDATIKYVSGYRGRSDREGVIRCVRGTLTISLLLGGITASAVIAVAPHIVLKVFRVQPSDYWIALRALQIGGIVIFLRSIDSVFASALRGHETYAPAAKIAVFVKVSTITSAVLLVALGFGVVAIMIATLVAVTLGVVLQAIKLRHVVPGICLWPTADHDTWKEILGFGFYTWVQGFGGMIFNYLDRLLVGAFMGTAAVAYYAVCLQLAQPVHGLMAAGLNFLFPHFSAKYESGDASGLRRVYSPAVALNVLLAVGLCLPLVLFGDRILALWMGAAFASNSHVLLVILAISFGLLSVTVVPHFLLLGLGKARFVSLVNLAGGILSMVAAGLLIPPLGLAGAAIGRLFYGPVVALNYVMSARILKEVSAR